jgi:hypothetical protein
MLNYILLFFLVVLFVVPFSYIIIVDIIELFKRMHELYNLKLKPVTTSIINNIIR